MPVVDKELKCLGVVTVHNLVQAFISPLDSDDLNTVETNPHQVAKTLKATTEYQTVDKEKLKVYNIYNICVDFKHFKKLFKDYTVKEWA